MSGTNITIDDSDPRVVYSNQPGWDTAVWGEQDPQPLDDSNHSTLHLGATATLTFEGTAGKSLLSSTKNSLIDDILI
jgi:hypothetical protein